MPDAPVKKMLVLVEGEKTDVRLIKNMLGIFEIGSEYEIVSYNTNIYALYDEMFKKNESKYMDLLETLKAREKDPAKKLIFDERYTDILLVFDLDMQDTRFSQAQLLDMQQYFSESSDMGKLYINYPMVESFYHMSSFPDPAYFDRKASVAELKNYKHRVNRETRKGDYRKFAVTRDDWTYVICENLRKGFMLAGDTRNDAVPDAEAIMKRQFNEIEQNQAMFVLCTCLYFIAEYNPALLLPEAEA